MEIKALILIALSAILYAEATSVSFNSGRL